MKHGITLIGMPGAGKSMVGKRLAARLGWKFLDLDDYIVETEGISHHDFMLKHGEQALLDLENRLTLGLDFGKMVFAPPGSIVYSKAAMRKLQNQTVILYLAVSLQTVKRHLGEKVNRNGIIGLADKGIEQIFAERTPLYVSYADYMIDCEGLEDKEQKTEKVYEVIKGLVRSHEISQYQ